MDTIQKTLSIRLQPDGFLFSTHNITEDDSFSLQEVPIAPGPDYNSRLKNRILDTKELLCDYKEIHITVATPRFTLFPVYEIEEATAGRFYGLTCSETKEPETLLQEIHTGSGIGFIFGIDQELCNFLNRTFPEVKYHHPLCILHSYFSEKSKMGNNAKMIVQLPEHGIDLLVYRNGRLQLANSYPDNGIENMAYHIMNTWLKCGLDARQDLLQLAGNKAIQAKLTELLSPLLKHIMPAVFPAQLFSLGQATLNAPWDTILLTFYPHL